jgi:hypothetical protein
LAEPAAYWNRLDERYTRQGYIWIAITAFTIAILARFISDIV